VLGLFGVHPSFSANDHRLPAFGVAAKKVALLVSPQVQVINPVRNAGRYCSSGSVSQDRVGVVIEGEMKIQTPRPPASFPRVPASAAGRRCDWRWSTSARWPRGAGGLLEDPDASPDRSTRHRPSLHDHRGRAQPASPARQEPLLCDPMGQLPMTLDTFIHDGLVAVPIRQILAAQQALGVPKAVNRGLRHTATAQRSAAP